MAPTFLAVLVDLATCGGDNLEQCWLRTFGDLTLLTTDETALLARAATSEQRISYLFNWQDHTERELDIDETEIEGDDNTNGAQPALTPRQMLTALADTYRQIILDLLDRMRETATMLKMLLTLRAVQTKQMPQASSPPDIAPSRYWRARELLAEGSGWPCRHRNTHYGPSRDEPPGRNQR